MIELFSIYIQFSLLRVRQLGLFGHYITPYYRSIRCGRTAVRIAAVLATTLLRRGDGAAGASASVAFLLATNVAILTRQSAYATLTLGFDWEVSDMAKAGRPRGTTVVDTHIGQKLRARRILLGLSQTELADAAGISFQQFRNMRREQTASGRAACNNSVRHLASRHLIFLKAYQPVGKKHPRRRKVSYRKARSFHFSGLAKAPLLSERSCRSNKNQFAKTLLSFLRL